MLFVFFLLLLYTYQIFLFFYYRINIITLENFPQWWWWRSVETFLRSNMNNLIRPILQCPLVTFFEYFICFVTEKLAFPDRKNVFLYTQLSLKIPFEIKNNIFFDRVRDTWWQATFDFSHNTFLFLRIYFTSLKNVSIEMMKINRNEIHFLIARV